MLIKKTNNSRSWKCVLGRKGNCKAELKLNILDEFVEEVNEHTHLLSETQVEVQKVRAGALATQGQVGH